MSLAVPVRGPRARPWPEPPRTAVLGHLPAWSGHALALLEAGAARGEVFGLRLWRPVLVGHTPEWNRLVLGHLEDFRSRGSLSQLSPYLSGGVVATDAPDHRARRAALNPAFHRRVVTQRFADRLAAVVDAALPTGEFDASEWSSRVVRAMMAAVFVGPRFPMPVLERFLAPLDQPLPGPLLRRPVRIRRLERALGRAFTDPDPDTLAPLFAGLDGGVEEARVAMAAAYDTTAHTLTCALWELAGRPDLDASAAADVVAETLRLHPAGWVGSRVATRDVEFGERVIPAGRMVLYSPYLTHRNPELWPDPLEFRPERFADPLPAWGYLPFSAGARTCLGAALATLMLRTVVRAIAGTGLARVGTALTVRGGLTLTPVGPVLLRRPPRTGPMGTVSRAAGP